MGDPENENQKHPNTFTGHSHKNMERKNENVK